MNNKSLDIVIHQPRLSYYLGGGEIVPMEQAKFLSKRDHNITILTRKHREETSVFREFRKKFGKKIRIVALELNKEEEALLEKFPVGDWKRWNLEAMLFGKKALGYYRKNLKGVDLIATHLSTDSILIPSGPKNILQLHGEPSQMTDAIRAGLKRPDAFCSVSSNVHAFWKKNIKGKPIKLIHNGIDVVKFNTNELRNRDIDILFVGRFIENKGIQDILLAIKKYRKEKIIFVGDGPLKNEVARQVRFKKNIKIFSKVAEKKLVEFYQRSKIFLCPSTSKEGVLTTMLEAATCGCAIVTTNCCGMKDFAKNGTNSILVKPHSPRLLGKAIDKLLINKKLRDRLIRQAQKDIKKWEWQKKVKELENFYRKICR